MQTELNIPRKDFPSTRLPDGRIIVVGGWCDSDLLDSTEVWEPSSGAWRELPGMGTHAHRTRHSGCLLTDDRFAVFGGFVQNYDDGDEAADDATTLASCQALVLDSGAERWEPMPRMLEARAGFACAAVGACVIVAGGEIGDDDDYDLSSVEVYEEATGVWRRLPCDMPRAVSFMGSDVL